MKCQKFLSKILIASSLSLSYPLHAVPSFKQKSPLSDYVDPKVVNPISGIENPGNSIVFLGADKEAIYLSRSVMGKKNYFKIFLSGCKYIRLLLCRT